MLDTVTHSMAEITRSFCALGWEVCVAIEAELGPPERAVFVALGRLDRFLKAENHPAIYLLHLRKTGSAYRKTIREHNTLVSGARCVLGPQRWKSAFASVDISGGRVSHILCDTVVPSAATSTLEVDLSGYLLMPGLINAHDHLEFALFPRMGNPRYKNATDWSMDIQASFSDVIAKHRAVPRSTRLWWGGLRNLLCGVTTVCHHNPLEPELRRRFPVEWSSNMAGSIPLHSAPIFALRTRLHRGGLLSLCTHVRALMRSRTQNFGNSIKWEFWMKAPSSCTGWRSMMRASPSCGSAMLLL